MNFTETIEIQRNEKIYDARVHVCFEEHIQPFLKSKEEFLSLAKKIAGNIKNNNPETWKDYTVEFMDRSFVWNYYHIESIEVEPNFDESCSFLVAVHNIVN